MKVRYLKDSYLMIKKKKGKVKRLPLPQCHVTSNIYKLRSFNRMTVRYARKTAFKRFWGNDNATTKKNKGVTRRQLIVLFFNNFLFRFSFSFIIKYLLTFSLNQAKARPKAGCVKGKNLNNLIN